LSGILSDSGGTLSGLTSTGTGNVVRSTAPYFDGGYEAFAAGNQLGTSSSPIQNLWLYGNGTYGSTSIVVSGTPTGSRTATMADGTSSTVITAQFTTAGATTSDNITIQGVTGSSKCAAAAVNALAATGITSAYVSGATANQITLNHSNTNGQIFNIVCSVN
jgi:hypothetical protein